MTGQERPVNVIQGSPEDGSPHHLMGLSPDEAYREFLRRLEQALDRLEARG